MLRWIFNKKIKNIIILDKDRVIGEFDDKNPIEVILTPSYYWFVKRKLPIKFAFQAKEYLPSIFEEFGISEKDHSYTLLKKDDEFWLYAYSDKTISKALENRGINPSMINKIHFAQNIFNSKKPIDLNNGYTLADINGTLCKIPSNLVKDRINIQDLRLEDIELDKGNELKKYSSIIDEKTVKKLLIPIFLLAVLYALQTYFLYRENLKLEKQKDEIFSKYSLLSTTFQNRAVLKNLQNKNLTQKRIRYILSVLFSMPFSKNEYIQSLDISDNQAKITIRSNDSSRLKIFKRYLLKHNIKVKISNQNIDKKTVSLEVSL